MGFSRRYMLVKAAEAEFVDLVSILFSSNLEKRKFLESSEEATKQIGSPTREESFGYRWMIFMSVMLEKLLMLFSKPMALMGLLIETWLNFLSHNPNIFVFIVNLVQGSLIPDRDSEKFISFTGFQDRRMKLDRDIKPADGCKYYSALCMMASKASYENDAYIKSTVEDHWKMEYLGFYDCWNDYQGKATTQLFLLRDRSDDHDTIVVAFRGTEPFDADAWCTDADLSWYELPKMGKVHFGFTKALGMPKLDKNDEEEWPVEYKEDGTRKQPLAYYFVRDKLKALLSGSEKTKYVVTGHSLGGALAILFPSILAFHEEELLLKRLEGVYTYGQPRVADRMFGECMEKRFKDHQIQYFRSVYCNDIVPRLPYDDNEILYKHFGTCLYYNRHYHGKVVRVIPNKNYFSALHAMPMRINSTLELLRSFTICYSKGQAYKEGWFLRFFRIIGLVNPGVSAHSTQDYVNSTRIGSSDLFLPQEEM